ncbi:virulence-associated protein VagC [Ereboglobus sp. PH5-5]|uniref:antitoxin n=1 Tax=unclassified Ereboglobus TaxID=2626932 RepID=UPI00240648AA|nr:MULTISPECIES: AbrB/MazE/SpoVT family DNA-binding domain-containing protein [unclassified Ereboglobus]MDF9826684.1 virulence-associated protein VagC [Ereboglobus sp. PH5-10]MDF9833428.1 virulence-associated protein VagC [Ereboglobus sp. PH5-5]
MTTTAKVFKAGNSQAVRLPKGFRFKSKTVQLVKNGSTVTLIDPADQARRRRAIEKLYKTPPVLPPLERP